VNYSILNSGYSTDVNFIHCMCLPGASISSPLFSLSSSMPLSAARRGNEIATETEGIWSTVPEKGGGELGDAMRALKAMRGVSLARRYVIEDFLTWGMPIITRLFLLSCTGRIHSAAQIAECISKLNTMRRHVFFLCFCCVCIWCYCYCSCELHIFFAGLQSCRIASRLRPI